MTRTAKAIIGACALAALAAAQMIPGVPQPVVDVQAVPAWATHLANDITKIEKAAVTILRIEAMIAHLKYQAQYLENTAAQWGWLTHPWTNAYFADSTGLNTGWEGAVNRDLNTIGAYSQIVAGLNNDLHYNPGGFSMDSQRSIAMIERMDGHVKQSTSIVGQYSVANEAYQARLARLSTSVYSNNPDDQTNAAQIQKTNSAMMLLLENSNMAAELAKRQLEHNTEEMIMQRERIVEGLNSEAQFAATSGVLTADQGPIPVVRIP